MNRDLMTGLTTGPRPARPQLRVMPPPAAIPVPNEFLRRVLAQREAEQQASSQVDLALPPMPAAKTAKLNFEALKAETPPGCCIGCDGPLPKGKQMLCGDPQCLQVYRDVWYGDRNAAQTAKRNGR